MSGLLQFLMEHGPVLLAGTTAVLAIGAACMAWQRSPIHRQRMGELTVLAALVWLGLTCLPLPRLSMEPAEPVVDRSAPVPGDPAIDELPVAEFFVPLAPMSPAVPDEPRPVVRSSEASAAIWPQGLEAAAAPRAVSARPAARFDWVRAAAGTYLAGVAGCAGWMVLGHVALRRLLRAARAPERWLAELFRELDAPASCRLLISAAVSRPISCGIFRPVVLLPRPCATREREAQLRQVIRHELAHVAQRDAIGHALFNLALPLLYFHPLYWVIRARTFLARELVADDRAAAAGSKESYVSELVALAAQHIQRRRGHANVIGIFESTTHFYRRMHMLIERQIPLATRCSKKWRLLAATVAALLLSASTLFVGVNSVQAQTTPDSSGELARVRAERDEMRRELAILRNVVQELRQVNEQLHKAAADSARARRDRLQERNPQERGAIEETEVPVAGDERRPETLPRQLKQQQEPGAANLRPQLDLISLANSYIDAVGDVQLREVELVRFQQMAERNVAAHSELERAKIALETARRKERLFRGMAEAALRSADAEYKRTKLLVEQGLLPSTGAVEAESRMQVLKLILRN